MSKHTKILDQLRIIALDVAPVRSSKIASAIVYRKQIVGLGVCAYKTHPMQAKFAKNSMSIFIHAEIAAITNAIQRMRDTEFLKESTLYIARQRMIANVWQDGVSCPCSGCQRAIVAFGIPNVIWTENV